MNEGRQHGPAILAADTVELGFTAVGLPGTGAVPGGALRPHTFFVQRVCGGKECTAVGWYDDREIVYIDEKYHDQESGFAASLLVHELTHYLQHQSGRFDSLSCTDSVAREREAYRVQNDYILQAQASFNLIRPAPTSCSYTAAAATEAPMAHEGP